MTFPDMVPQNIGANPLATRAHRAFHRHIGAGICLGALLHTGDTELLMRKRARGVHLCAHHGCLALPIAGTTKKAKLLDPCPQLEGPRQSVGVCIPNSRGHAKAWESVSPTRGATPNRGKENKKDERKNAVHSLQKEFGTALGPGFCSEGRIFTSQQTTFV